MKWIATSPIYCTIQGKPFLIKNKPEIDFSKMEVLAKEVQNKMSKIDFENIVVTEKTLKIQKNCVRVYVKSLIS